MTNAAQMSRRLQGLAVSSVCLGTSLHAPQGHFLRIELPADLEQGPFKQCLQHGGSMFIWGRFRSFVCLAGSGHRFWLTVWQSTPLTEYPTHTTTIPLYLYTYVYIYTHICIDTCTYIYIYTWVDIGNTYPQRHGGFIRGDQAGRAV